MVSAPSLHVGHPLASAPKAAGARELVKQEDVEAAIRQAAQVRGC